MSSCSQVVCALLGWGRVTPSARSLAECKKRGWRAQVVERRVPYTKTTIDLFGFGDIVALDGAPGVLMIQATSTPNMAARVSKIRTECWEAALEWLRAGNRIEVWGFAKRGPRGKRKLWTLKTQPIELWCSCIGICTCGVYRFP